MIETVTGITNGRLRFIVTKFKMAAIFKVTSKHYFVLNANETKLIVLYGEGW
jgi:hypothetical protein